MNFRSLVKPALFSAAFVALTSAMARPLGDFHSSAPRTDGSGVDLKDSSGATLTLRAYGDGMVRVQAVPAAQKAFPDDHYQMIEHHDLGGSLQLVAEDPTTLTFTNGKLRIVVNKKPLSLSFVDAASGKTLLSDAGGIYLDQRILRYRFAADATEQFMGYGQKRLALQESYLLKDRTERRNYGEEGYPGRGSQGVLTVPFFLSSKGYGFFANTTYPTEGHFGIGNDFSFQSEPGGEPAQADYVFIYGPTPAEILARYTQLTGHPRLPPKSIFGLQLSDNDPRLPDNKPVDHAWWETMVTRHRAAGFPLDHMVFDNDWRAAAENNPQVGGWSGSQFSFDPTRYPSPPAFHEWYAQQGLTLTLDLNLNNGNDSAGWLPSYNILPADFSSSRDSIPDYTNPATRRWLWQLLWDKAFDPTLHFPGDAIWLDESDGVNVPANTRLANGRSWHEMKNYYFFLNAYAAVAEGWDNVENGTTPGIGEEKRPHVWVRGGTAGMQRYASHWTGDIDFTTKFYRGQIIGMQASGLAGFPYFNHDAGGFGANPKDPEASLEGPNDDYYIQWGMALGSFTPLWRPHGYGFPRWPLNRNAACQDAFRHYATLRYELMPYIYSLAHLAHATGLPMARAMPLVYPDNPVAWQPAQQLQYHWGDAFLVVPPLQVSGTDTRRTVWIPPAARWYNFWNDECLPLDAAGGAITFTAKYGQLPVFVRAGAIVPRQDFALSTAWLSDAHLTLDVYAGADGSFTLFEDDGVSERFQTRGELRRTTITYQEAKGSALTIAPASGTYRNASPARSYLVRIHGLDAPPALLTVDGRLIALSPSPEKDQTSELRAAWHPDQHRMTITLPATPTTSPVNLEWR